LNTLKHTVGLDWFQITRETIQVKQQGELWVDIWRFRELLALGLSSLSNSYSSAHLQQAIALYRDDLLAGFTLRDAPAFEDWRYFNAETLRQQLTDAFKVLLQLQVAAGATNDALNTGRRWLALDALQEEAHQTLITLYLAAGNRAAALRQYERCVQLLDRELGVPPCASTRALFNAIKTQSVLTMPLPATG
jgi:DNA-binding SARP family transcriptional activator